MRVARERCPVFVVVLQLRGRDLAAIGRVAAIDVLPNLEAVDLVVVRDAASLTNRKDENVNVVREALGRRAVVSPASVGSEEPLLVIPGDAWNVYIETGVVVVRTFRGSDGRVVRRLDDDDADAELLQRQVIHPVEPADGPE